MGDFAYDLQDEGGLRGDEFQRQIQNLSAYVPYMTCVGNHEDNFNYSNYRHRFSNPRSQINEGVRSCILCVNIATHTHTHTHTHTLSTHTYKHTHTH